MGGLEKKLGENCFNSCVFVSGVCIMVKRNRAHEREGSNEHSRD